MQFNNIKPTKVVGNDFNSDPNYGYKEEVKAIFEAYNQSGVNLSGSLYDIISNPSSKEEFMDSLMESLTTSPVFTDGNCANTPFYNNYADRVRQMEENSFIEIARESAMSGYSPIVSYNPFFLKNQWVNCVFKDVVMTEVPETPVINLAYEKRFLKDMAGNEYPIPETLFDRETMKKLRGEATGLSIKEDPITLPMKSVDILTATYIPGIVVTDRSETLTPDICIIKVFVKDAANVEHEVPVNIRVDITTHNFVGSPVEYTVLDADGNPTDEIITDSIVGNVDFKTGHVTCFSTNDKITKIVLRGKTANRFNERSLDVVRRVEQQQFVMPESGPRFNSSVTVEDAADALVLQNIDVIADNVDVMGRTLADFEDDEIHSFLDDSYDRQLAAGVGPHGYASMIASTTFNALPYDGYTSNITQWMKDSREWFERTIAELKKKLRTENAVTVVVAHPNIIRFLQDGINWVFTDDTQISGMKLNYNFGILTSAQDRVHVITSMYMNEDEGIKFVVIPLTKELVTFKHYKYSTIIDRNYRNPLHNLTPNIMVTHRTLTFEVLPVQGKMTISGRDLFSPETLVRPTTP